ncbi:hypothetical protein [Sphingomonas panni]|uniref:hypothetical protein n=1 Tax=Sphingomonas panni TaxID=237612 RepID=UPI001F5BA3B7|nr:hypothetical protein [Sphingomonas panni]
MTRADSNRRGRRTTATGAAIVAAAEIAVEADAAATTREAEAATPDTAAGAAVVAAAEVAGEVAAGEAEASAERVAEAITPADPVVAIDAASVVAPAVEPSPSPVAPAPIDPFPTRKHDMSNQEQSPANVSGTEEGIDLLSGAFSVTDIATALRRAQLADPDQVALLREALAAIGPADAAPIHAPEPATPGLDGLFGNVSYGRTATAPLGSVRRFRLVSPIIDGDGGVPAGEWVKADRDYHALLLAGLSVDVDWDGGLPL